MNHKCIQSDWQEQYHHFLSHVSVFLKYASTEFQACYPTNSLSDVGSSLTGVQQNENAPTCISY